MIELSPIYAIAPVLTGLISLLVITLMRKRMLSFGLRGVDINKEKRPETPEAGGMLLLPAIWIVTFALVQLEWVNPMAYVFMFTVTCFAALGFFDDAFKLFKKEKGWSKYVANRAMILFAVTLPFTYLIMPILTGGCPCTLYWYIVIGSLVILAASSLANSFAGLNGWEVGSSAIVLAGLTVMVSFAEFYTKTLVVLALIMLGAQLALWYFNKYPARIFPGDSGTLLVGASMGCLVLFIDRWYLAVGLFAPHILDIFLKLRTNSDDISQKKERPYALKDGKIHIPESGKLDFAKFLVKKLGPMDEKRLVRKIHMVVIQNTLFWTLLYILLKIT